MFGSENPLNLPLGYQYSAYYAGIRKTQQDDLGLIVSDKPANAAGIFTQNRVVADPVKLSKAHLKRSRGLARAILVNAGNANCATRTGATVALHCCEALARQLKSDPEQVLPASTGVIGVELPEQLIIDALPHLVHGLSPRRFEDVARAIMTTDQVMKTALQEVSTKDGPVRVAGMTKGSGMIQPRMATTLGFILTDATLLPKQLAEMLDVAAGQSYHRISVDGDTSTNDTLLLLANGASGVEPGKKDREAIQDAVSAVAESLAIQIARDGEGARKLISIFVSGADDSEAAAQIARAIANSPLVKTAVAGSDPNWGRIIAAAGNAGVRFNPQKVSIEVNGVLVCERGLASDFDEAALKAQLDSAECQIRFAIRGKGKGEARFWTCDLTEKYIEINASYRT
ncbi:MAG: bifunctional glutamate N-acetyltransferase/amino-acid acetyltransferase ArgJ [Acidobacteriaceae bacterium]|nr:bifunctional glutamate N-acetyltransferase/amino-acid acetyltransferase ArgJ [Acidobacteriaceae bacterium]